MEKFSITFMEAALHEANKAFLLQEVPVGCVITHNGEIIGSGHNQVIKDNLVSSHAEIKAIENASYRLENYRLINCDMYVTLEPCHMCAKAIVDARLNVDLEIERTIGPSRWLIPIQVKQELERMNQKRNDLLLDLLFSRTEIIESTHAHTDDALLALAMERGARVLTVDKELKRRLVAEGCGYLEVVRDRSLRLVE